MEAEMMRQVARKWPNIRTAGLEQRKNTVNSDDPIAALLVADQ
jgi:hypothetical protein